VEETIVPGADTDADASDEGEEAECRDRTLSTTLATKETASSVNRRGFMLKEYLGPSSA